MVITLPHQRPAVGRKFRPDEGSSRHVIRRSVLCTVVAGGDAAPTSPA